MKSLTGLFRGGPAAVAPEIRAFQSRPEEIRVGDAAVIEWNVRGADSVQIDNEIGVVPLSGSRRVNPTATTTYTLMATKHGVTTTSTATLRVATQAAFEGALVLNDVFAGDVGGSNRRTVLSEAQSKGDDFAWNGSRTAQHNA